MQSAARLESLVFTSGDARFNVDVRSKPEQHSSLAHDVLVGLRGAPKSLPPKYFYDEVGSQLFDQICDTPEYYPTRTEQALLGRFADSIVHQTNPRCIVELGSGSARKISTVLAAVERSTARCRYVPFDVSRSMLEASSRELLLRFPWLEVHAIAGDYDRDFDALPLHGPTLFVFLGGTIGNFTPAEAALFLRKLRGHMRAGDHLLLGTDLIKDHDVLNAAYNDAAGVTAGFNKNVLAVINRRLDASFDADAFRHVAFFDPSEARIEMHLESTRAQSVPVRALGLEVEFAAGERILTEISRKFTRASVDQMLRAAGLGLDAWFAPTNGYFGLSVARRVEEVARETGVRRR